MVDFDSNADKEPGSTARNNKTAVITIDLPGGETRTVEAQHYIKSDSGTVSIYLGSRSEGIDTQTHISRCVIDRVDSHADDEPAPEFADVDYVDYDGEGWRLCCVVDSNSLVIDQPYVARQRVPVEDCTPTDVNGTPLNDDDEDKPLVTDGGCDVYTKECNGYNCAAILTDRDRDRCSGCRRNNHRGLIEKNREIVENADVDTGDIVRYDDRSWLVEGFDEWHYVVLVPEGVVPGRHLDDEQYEVVDVQDVERVNTDDAGRDGSDPELVTDGGREIVNGDSVLHAGERWRVARVGASQVEIYQLGNGSEIVPIGAVELVSEVQG